jgi:sortase B
MIKNKKVAVTVCATVALLIAVLMGFAYIQYRKEISSNVENMYILLEQAKVPEETAETVLEEQKAPEEENEETAIHHQHDFETLKEINQDIYAWINLPDTQVDYPVLQADTDDKYLEVNLDGSNGYPGCIYSNLCNSKDFSDYITVLYGHNMKSGEMFGSLHNFDDAEFFNAFDTYTVETEDTLYIYSVYAAVNYNDKLIPAYYDVKTEAGRNEFIASLDNCRGNSLTHFNDNITIGDKDKLLVLSVCIGGQPERRYLIVSKLENTYKY